LPLKRPAWPLLWCSRPWGVGVGSRRTLEDPVKTGHHPLGVVAVVVTIAAIVLITGLFLRLPPLPGFRSARLQRLALEVLLLLFLFQVQCGLLLLRGLSPLVTIDLVLLHWKPRGSNDPYVGKDKS